MTVKAVERREIQQAERPEPRKQVQEPQEEAKPREEQSERKKIAEA